MQCVDYGWNDFLPESFDLWADAADLNLPAFGAETCFGSFASKDFFASEPLCAPFTKDFYGDLFLAESNATIIPADEGCQDLSAPEQPLEVSSSECVKEDISRDVKQEEAAHPPAQQPLSDEETKHVKVKGESKSGNRDENCEESSRCEAQATTNKKRSIRSHDHASPCTKKSKLEVCLPSCASVDATSSCCTPSSAIIHTKRQRQPTPPLAQAKRAAYEKKKTDVDVSRSSSSAGPSVLLECKFVSKRTGFRCSCTPFMTVHKRGHLSVACSSGHQWVWCSECCKCGSGNDGARRGCGNKTHWFERDAFDTGRRNHMRTAHGVDEADAPATGGHRS